MKSILWYVPCGVDECCVEAAFQSDEYNVDDQHALISMIDFEVSVTVPVFITSNAVW